MDQSYREGRPERFVTRRTDDSLDEDVTVSRKPLRILGDTIGPVGPLTLARMFLFVSFLMLLLMVFWGHSLEKRIERLERPLPRGGEK